MIQTDAKVISKVTPYYMHHCQLGAVMMKKGDWIRPGVFSSVEDEVYHTRCHVGIIDAHSMGKFEVVGSDADVFMQQVMTNDLSKIKKGRQGIYTCLCNEEGGIIDDVIVYYLSDDRFYLITNTFSRERVSHWLQKVKNMMSFQCHIIDVTNLTAYLSIQGPDSLPLIAELFNERVMQLNYFECMNTSLRNVPVLVARTGYTGESGFEINFPSEYGHFVWEHIFDAGQKFQAKPVGGQAIQVLRSEKAYRSHGTDITVDTNPIEAGLSWVVQFNKPEFLGKKALSEIKKNGVQKKLKGFYIRDNTLLKKGTKLISHGHEAGYITTCCYSPTLNKTIAMGYIYQDYFRENTFTADHLEKTVALVTKMPFYDPEGSRTK